MEKPTIIITGGTGFIGSHTCVELMDSYNLVVVDNLLNSKKEVIDKVKQITQKENIEFYNFDLLDINNSSKSFPANYSEHVSVTIDR